MYKIGVMQGRLLRKYKGLYQAHPVGYWQDEFPVALKYGVDSIEYILDYEGYKKNPLFTREGRNEIVACINKTGIRVRSICADYFMVNPLHGNNNVSEAEKVLLSLMDSAEELGVECIVLPCVDNSSFNGNKLLMLEFVARLKDVLSRKNKMSVRIALETDLSPIEFVWLLDKFENNNVYVNYDIGNSACLGFDCRDEIRAYGEMIIDTHIKDRKKLIDGGQSVVLGCGEARFDTIWSMLMDIKYDGLLIMQAYRDDEGLEIFLEQLGWVRRRLREI